MTEQRANILIADDSRSLLKTAELQLGHIYNVHTAITVQDAKSVLMREKISVAIVDLNFEGQEEDGLVLMDYIADKHKSCAIVVLSRDKVTDRIVNATRRKHTDFIVKEGSYIETLKFALQRGLEQKRADDEKKSKELKYLTRSPKILKIIEQVDRVVEASPDLPILIFGESGTGKEILAQYIASKMGKHIIAANMASIPASLAESRLFGHTKGSFTGATQNQTGLIEQAHNGIFFLDELGDCPSDVQVKLLRTLQENEIHPLGAPKPKTINVRFIGATHRNLREMVYTGKFRLDLFERLNGFSVELPPLRERPEDIMLFAARFAKDLNVQIHFAESGITALTRHPWPGNVRQLENLIKRLPIYMTSGVVDAKVVAEALGTPDTNRQSTESRIGISKDHFTRGEVVKALEVAKGNRTRAADILGVNPTTVWRWMKKHNIEDVMAPQWGRPKELEIDSTVPPTQGLGSET